MPHQEALLRLAESIRDATGAFPALEEILARSLPRFSDRPRGAQVQTTDLAEQQQLARSLDRSYLLVQGPPGTGKTYTGARLIVDLIAAGQRVGVTALSHRAINNLLEAVEEAADEAGVAFEGARRVSGTTRTAASRTAGGRSTSTTPRSASTSGTDSLAAPPGCSPRSHSTRPGADALFLFALANVLFEEGLVDPGGLEGHVAGADELAAGVEPFTPEEVGEATGVDPDRIRRLARELAGADSAAVYGRIGTHTAEFGTMASWMVDVLNVLTGNLDRPGGAMFSHAAHEQPRSPRGFQVGRWQSRVKGLPEVRGELPVSTMADEILEPGPGQIRALVTIAGNPILSTPSSDRLDAALAGLEFMVSVDIYLNETTRHADVILPGASPLRRPHYDFAFNQLSVRNVANYSPPLFSLPDDTPDEWQVLLRLGATVSGQGSDADVDALDDGVFAMMVGSTVGNPQSSIHGRDPEEIFSATTGDGDDSLRGPERMLDFLVRTGPYGDGYGANPEGLTLDRLKEAPHGIDLGPLHSRLPGDLCTPSGKVELAPEYLLADVPRLRASAARVPNGGFLLIGRRHIRSNNSWMHNIDVLVKGKERCTLQISDQDAQRLGLGGDARVKVSSTAGTLTVPVEITDSIMPGVVSLPHGWGHDLEGSTLSVASERPGVNTNRLSTGAMDPASGNAILNGIPVEVVPV